MPSATKKHIFVHIDPRTPQALHTSDNFGGTFAGRWRLRVRQVIVIAAMLSMAPMHSMAQSIERQDGEGASSTSAQAAASEGFLLPTVETAGGDRSSRGVVNTLVGYDGGTKNALMRVTGDVKAFGPLDLRLGLTYTPGNEEGEVQPMIGARVRILNQEDHAINLSTAVYYRMERFTDDEGFVQGVLALSRRWGRLGAFLNGAYGQDPEGDDRLADFGVALLYTLNSAWIIGLESDLKVDLASEDPKRDLRDDRELEFTAGPVATWSIGPIGLVAQAGIRTLKFESGSRTGALLLGGVSYAH